MPEPIASSTILACPHDAVQKAVARLSKNALASEQRTVEFYMSQKSLSEDDRMRLVEAREAIKCFEDCLSSSVMRRYM